MKRIKMMLLSLSLFAVVGGALAFKANYELTFCTADPASPTTCPNTCPNFTPNVEQGIGTLVCTAQYDGNECKSNPACAPTPIQIKSE